jgi:hypothetical protein
MQTMPKLDRQAIIERLKSMADPALGTIQDAFQGSKVVKCPRKECGERFEVKIPDVVAVRAALDTLKLIPGIGTTSKVERAVPTGNSWENLVQALCEYPLQERVELARKILPEFSSLFDSIESFRISNGGDSPAAPTN